MQDSCRRAQAKTDIKKCAAWYVKILIFDYTDNAFGKIIIASLNKHIFKGDSMKVYMLKDVERIGMAGQIISVSDGYGTNFLLPRKLAVEVTEGNLAFYQQKKIKEQVVAEVLNSKIAMVAERIKTLQVSIKERVHDDGKLYGAISSDEIVDLLKAKDISINKKQVEFDKSIKSVGEHKVTIRLSSKLKPQLTVKVEAEKKPHATK